MDLVLPNIIIVEADALDIIAAINSTAANLSVIGNVIDGEKKEGKIYQKFSQHIIFIFG